MAIVERDVEVSSRKGVASEPEDLKNNFRPTAHPANPSTGAADTTRRVPTHDTKHATRRRLFLSVPRTQQEGANSR